MQEYSTRPPPLFFNWSLISSQAAQWAQVNLPGSQRTVIRNPMDSEHYWLRHHFDNLSPNSLWKAPQTHSSMQRHPTFQRIRRNVRKHSPCQDNTSGKAFTHWSLSVCKIQPGVLDALYCFPRVKWFWARTLY